MTINAPHKTKIYHALSALVSLALLSGCAKFHEKYDPLKEGWARQKGDKSLTVQGYMTPDGKKNLCFEQGVKAVLIPNDDYAKKYAKFIIQTDSNPLGRSISQEGRSVVRFANGRRNCIYNFKNVPAGKWIIVFDIHNTIMPLITVATDKGPASNNVISSGNSYVWAEIDIKPTDHDLKKKFVLSSLSPKQDSVLNFKWGDDVSVHQGQLLDWNSSIGN